MVGSMERSTVNYTDSQLKDALASLNEGGQVEDCQHLYGYDNYKDHKLSMLQIVQATQILDYQAKLNDPSTPSEADLVEQAKEFAKQHGPVLNLQKVIQSQSPSMALAAEFKRASPSKGVIAPHLIPGEQAKLYASAGANIISVLTEPHWFLGSLQDMTDARLQTTTTTSSNNITIQKRPAILRKDFIVSNYMIAEAAASGADTVLLIVAVLPRHLLKSLIEYARSLQLEPLVEVHALEDLDVALYAGARVIGVNNRNLHTFQVDMSNTEQVTKELTKRGLSYHHDQPEMMAAEYTVCALSGMSSAFDVDRYRQAGVGMCLIGESLMRAADPTRAIESLCLNPQDFVARAQTTNKNGVGGGGAYTGGTKLIKVCGVTNAEDALVACRSGANLIGVIFATKSKRKVTVEQAQEVVQAVRQFGERSDRIVPSIPDNEGSTSAPLPHLVASARALEDAAKRPMVVGVFQNQSPNFVSGMVTQCGLDLVQLHGNEGMEAANVERCGGVHAIRVVDIETDSTTGKAVSGAAKQIIDSITTDPVAILLDTSIKGSKDGGGTGVTFDWSIAQDVQNAGLPVIIAGGLHPDNVREAVGTTRPWGIDVSSGVEQSPGKKDSQKVQDYVKSAREAAVEASKGF